MCYLITSSSPHSSCWQLDLRSSPLVTRKATPLPVPPTWPLGVLFWCCMKLGMWCTLDPVRRNTTACHQYKVCNLLRRDEIKSTWPCCRNRLFYGLVSCFTLPLGEELIPVSYKQRQWFILRVCICVCVCLCVKFLHVAMIMKGREARTHTQIHTQTHTQIHTQTHTQIHKHSTVSLCRQNFKVKRPIMDEWV